MKYGLFIYEESHNGLINIGDYIQSIAARQFLPKDFTYIERDQLDKYYGEELKIIMNGWFTHKPENWPPSSAINPLFVSYHLNKSVVEKMMGDFKIVEYFKSKSPIGCRDYDSVVRMNSVGIDAYYTGCLTTTLNYNGKLFGDSPIQKSSEILLVDINYKDDIKLRGKRNKLYLIRDLLKGDIMDYNKVEKYINNLVPEKFKKNVGRETCYYNANTSHEKRFNHAKNLLKRIAEAKVVVTSRIHIALPSLALGTPVLFVLDGKLANKEEFRRLNGVINFMNVLVDNEFDTSVEHLKGINFIRKTEIDWNNPPKNPILYESIRDGLIEKVKSFVD